MQTLTIQEEIVMTTILRLGDDAYGVSIRKKAAELTQKTMMYGTPYNVLSQLVRKGLISKSKGDPTAERGGRSKMYYALTPTGLEALRHSRELHRSIWDGLPELAANGADRVG